MSDAKITVDLTGAIRKTQALKAIPSAFKYQVTSWVADTILELKRSAAGMQASGPGRKTGQMARNIGHEIKGTDAAFEVIVGTGVGGKQSVVYAGIQDRGGTIHKKNKRLTIPFPGVKGFAREYQDTFVIKSKAGNTIICQRQGKKGKLKPLFLLRDEVTLPATHWFSGPMAQRLAYLAAMTTPEAVFEVAQRRAAGLKIGNID
jgi:hypothetical protein